VKPIHLNLASRPYRDYRPVYAVVVVMSLLTAFLMLNNIDTYYRYIHETQNTRAGIAAVEAQTQQERQRAQAVQQRMSSLDLELLDAQAKFVNARLYERAFSWSALLDELESILTDDVRLISVTPTFTDKGPVQLSMQFESKVSDGLTTTINRMNNDPQFSNPFPTGDTALATGNFSFGLTAEYLPRAVGRIPLTAKQGVRR
jgi:hypothetical protein